MAKNSLIMYASRGGNTEAVAIRFKQVFEKYGWECDTLKVTRQTDFDNLPFTPKNYYDLFCLGSLVIDGIPAAEIFHGRSFRLLRAGDSSQPRRMPAITDGFGQQKGIAFVTYTGGRREPPEATPALYCLELRMEDARIKCIGKFACCGGGHAKYRWEAPNIVSARMHCTLDEASAMLYRYIENPNYPEFANLTEEEREMFEYERNFPVDPLAHREASGNRDWHLNERGRPNERDLLKAEIFLEEILEDFYGNGVDAAPVAQYLCIA